MERSACGRGTLSQRDLKFEVRSFDRALQPIEAKAEVVPERKPV